MLRGTGIKWLPTLTKLSLSKGLPLIMNTYGRGEVPSAFQFSYNMLKLSKRGGGSDSM